MTPIISRALKEVKGYYCNHCGKFYAPEEIKKILTIEVVGDAITITDTVTTCPECDRRPDLEEFDPSYWSHLAALVQARHKGCVWFKVPIYDSKNDLFPVAYKTVHTVEEVEEIADWYCIEVVSAIIDEFGLLDIEVELQ